MTMGRRGGGRCSPVGSAHSPGGSSVGNVAAGAMAGGGRGMMAQMMQDMTAGFRAELAMLRGELAQEKDAREAQRAAAEASASKTLELATATAREVKEVVQIVGALRRPCLRLEHASQAAVLLGLRLPRAPHLHPHLAMLLCCCCWFVKK